MNNNLRLGLISILSYSSLILLWDTKLNFTIGNSAFSPVMFILGLGVVYGLVGIIYNTFSTNSLTRSQDRRNSR